MSGFFGNIFFALGGFTAVLFFVFLVYWDILFGFLVWLYASILLGKWFFLISLPGLPDIYLERIIFVFLFLIFFIEVIAGKESLLPNNPIDYLMAALIVILIISMGRTGFLSTRGDEYQPFHVFLTGYLFPFSFYYFGKTFLYSEKRIKILLQGLFFLFLYLVITAYLEHFKINQFIFPQYITNPLEGIHWGRARGPFLNAPANGWVIGSLFFTTLFLRAHTENIFVRAVMFLILLFCPVAIFYTYTRAVWLSFLLAPLALVFFSQHLFIRPRFLLFPLLFLILMVFFYWGNITSKERELGGVVQVSEVQTRIGLYQASKAIFRDVPLFGVGFGRFQRALPFYAAEAFPGTAVQLASQHNLFLGLLSEVGLTGLVPFLFIVLFVFIYSAKLYKMSEREGLISRDTVAVFWAIMVVYIVNAFFIQTQFFLSANAVVFLWVGMIVGLYQRMILSQLGSVKIEESQ